MYLCTYVPVKHKICQFIHQPLIRNPQCNIVVLILRGYPNNYAEVEVVYGERWVGL